MKWLSVDSPLTYSQVMVSDDGNWEIHLLQAGFGIYTARVYNAREVPGVRAVMKEFAGPRALPDAQNWVRERG